MSTYNIPSEVLLIAIATSAALCLFVQTVQADTIVAWGGNAYGESDAPADADFTAIAAGYWHSAALTAEGSLVAWGDDDKRKFLERAPLIEGHRVQRGARR